MSKVKRNLFIALPLLSLLVSGCGGAGNAEKEPAATGAGKDGNTPVTIKLSNWYAKNGQLGCRDCRVREAASEH
ncbi:hypothetical protein ACFTAO_16460 [Paenibacillus rhizoplanae]